MKKELLFTYCSTRTRSVSTNNLRLLKKRDLRPKVKKLKDMKPGKYDFVQQPFQQ